MGSPLTIVDLFATICTARGDDANDIAVRPIAMAHDQDSQHRTHAKEDKPGLVGGVLWIIDQETMLIRERGLRLLEGDPVLASVSRVLPFVPLEPQIAHEGIVLTSYVRARSELRQATQADPRVLTFFGDRDIAKLAILGPLWSG